MQERKATHWCKTPMACLAMLFILVLGCRTPQPNLKPAKSPDELNVPPQTAHYSDPAWPDKVVARDDPLKKTSDPFGAMNAKGGGPGMGQGVGGMSPGGTTGASYQGAGGGR